MIRHELLTNSDYHKRPELGATTLKALDREGPEYVAAKMADPASDVQDSRALVVGSAVHAVMDGTFDDSFFVAPDSYKTADSDKFAALCEGNWSEWGKSTLTAREFAEVRQCGNALRAKIGTHLVGRAKLHEPSIFWTQETSRYNVPCKCRPDLLVDDGHGGVLYLEIKTAAKTGPQAWRSGCWQWGYWLQQAHYEAGILAAGAAQVRTVFVVVRKAAPFDVRCYEFSEDDCAAAQSAWLRLVDQYAHHCATRQWSSDSLDSPSMVHLGLQGGEQLEGFDDE